VHVVALAIEQERQRRVDVGAVAGDDVDRFSGALLRALLV